MTTDHRKKANKKRDGRTRYEKGRRLHDEYPLKKLVRGKRGSDNNNPEIPTSTFKDIWPELF